MENWDSTERLTFVFKSGAVILCPVWCIIFSAPDELRVISSSAGVNADPMQP